MSEAPSSDADRHHSRPETGRWEAVSVGVLRQRLACAAPPSFVMVMNTTPTGGSKHIRRLRWEW